jgi:hypothetical protein
LTAREQSARKSNPTGGNKRGQSSLFALFGGIFWLKDESLEDSVNLPDPDIIAAEIVEDLQAALAQFAEITPPNCGRRSPRRASFDLLLHGLN